MGFSVSRKGSGGSPAKAARLLVLPPAIDMANHGHPPNCHVMLDMDRGELVMEPLLPVAADQVNKWLFACWEGSKHEYGMLRRWGGLGQGTTSCPC